MLNQNQNGKTLTEEQYADALPGGAAQPTSSAWLGNCCARILAASFLEDAFAGQ